MKHQLVAEYERHIPGNTEYCENVKSKGTKILSQRYYIIFEDFDEVTMLNIAETLLQHFPKN